MHLACSLNLANSVHTPLQQLQTTKIYRTLLTCISVQTLHLMSHQWPLQEETNNYAGRKPGDNPRIRKRSQDPASADAARCTLGEVLSDTPPNYSQHEYQSRHHGGLRIVLTRVSAGRPPKPASKSTRDEPFQIIEIHGNIRKCFGCGLPLRDGPPKYGVNDLLQVLPVS